MSESSWSRETGTGSGLHHAEYKTRPEARPFQRKDAGRLLGPVSQTARRHEVPRSTSALRQGQHSTRRHAEDTTKVGSTTDLSCEFSNRLILRKLQYTRPRMLHNSCQPLNRLTVYDYRRESKGTATLEQQAC